MKSVNSLQSAIGRQFAVALIGAAVANDVFELSRVSDKKFADVGDEKNVPYAIFKSTTRKAVTTQIDPTRALSIINGTDEHYKAVEVSTAAPVDAAVAKTEEAKSTNAAVASSLAKKGDKKEAGRAIIEKLTIDGKAPARKDVIKAFVEELGWSAAMSSTYHHKLVHGDWKNAAPVVEEVKAETAAESAATTAE